MAAPLPPALAQHLQALRDAITAVLPPADAVESLAPGQVVRGPVTTTTDDLNMEWSDLKDCLRETRGIKRWPGNPSPLTCHLTTLYLGVLLRGIVHMLPAVATDMTAKASKVFQRLVAAVTDMTTVASAHDVNTARSVWKAERRMFARDCCYASDASWDCSQAYVVATARFATQVARYLSNHSPMPALAADCRAQLQLAHWRFHAPPVKVVLVSCKPPWDEAAETNAEHTAEHTAQLAAQLSSQLHSRHWTPSLVDVDKVQQMRAALPLCRKLAEHVMRQIHGTRSKKVRTQVADLLRVVDQGVVVTAVTNADLERLFLAIPVCTLGGSKPEVVDSVRLLATLLQVCTRIAVCFGTADDRFELICTYNCLERNIDIHGTEIVFRSVRRALAEYHKHCGKNDYVNMAPMRSADEEHAAVMLDVVCALHNCIGCSDAVVPLAQLRLEGDVVSYPPGYVEPSASEVMSVCGQVPTYNYLMVTSDFKPLPHAHAPAVVNAVWQHALKCLKQIPRVTDPALVAAFERLQRYAANASASG
jgi:hypothetical protein